MKKSFGIILLGTFLLLSACSTTEQAKDTGAAVKETTEAAVAPAAENLAPAEKPAKEEPVAEAKVEEPLTVDEVIEKFKAANLEAESPTDMGPKDVGAAPTRFIEGKRILVPSLGDDAGGRVFLFEDQEDLDEMKHYYDELGKSSGMFFSWTAANKLILFQMNGEMEETEFNKYKEIIDSL